MSTAAEETPRTTPPRPAPEDVLFRERLLPGPGGWVVLVVLGAMLGVILVPLSLVLAGTIAGVGALVAVALGVLTAPVLTVDERTLTLGRAQVEHDLLGEPEVLTGEDWERTMGVGFEPLAFHCTRGWIHAGVRVPLEDPEDPTTAWVASTRRPEDLALALRTARGATARG